MTKIFISYSSKNRDLVKQLADDLELLLHDAQIWYDAELLRTGGQLWWDNILAQIRQCDIFIYAASPQILHSEPCRREYQYARALGKPVLPVTVTEVDFRQMPVELQATQVISFLKRSRSEQLDLRVSIMNLPRGVSLPDDPADWPTPPDVPLDPVGVLFDKISRLTTDGNEQRHVFLDIEDLSDDVTYKGFAPELLRRFIARDDMLIARNLRRAEELLAKLEPLTLPPKPDPVQEALTLARNFIREGKKNRDWTPFVAPLSDLKSGDVKIPDMRFCLVPTGKFMMGSDDKKYDDDEPVHEQTFYQPFYIAQYPVTNAQWALAVKAGAVGEPQGEEAFNWYKDPQMANAPVVGVYWFECQRFAAWMGCRLPNEREWEYAARGVDNLVYPWGNEFIPDNVVYRENSGRKPWNVRSKPQGRSWIEARHLSGNVWEWQVSLYESYPYMADGSRERDTKALRVLRGGSWSSLDTFVRAAGRNYDSPDFWSDFIGFRCALS